MGVGAVEELQVGQPGPSTPRRIPGGRPQGILTCPHSTPVKNIGPGVKVVISVENPTVAHGKNSSHPKPKIIEVLTSLFLLLTKNLFTVCYTRRIRIKKYMKLL